MNSQIDSLSLAPPGGKRSMVTCIKGDENTYEDSKRVGGIEKQETDLQSNMKHLDEGTRARNREFDVQMNYLQDMLHHLTCKLEIAAR